jgi:hypothetical protein
MANKLPVVAVAAMIERIKSIQPEVAELTEFLSAQGVDVAAVLAGAAPAEPTKSKGGMSKAQRKALSEKMKARHAAAKALKEAEAGGVAGTDATDTQTPTGIDLNPNPTPAAAPVATPA